MERKVFTSPGVLESSEKTIARRRNFREGFLEYNNTQNTARYEIFFDGLNFEILHDIFLEFVRRHGISVSEINFLGRENIFSSKNSMTGGSFLVENNIILLDDPDIETSPFIGADEIVRMKNEISKAYGSLDIYCLKKLVHEEVHAVSWNECVGMVGVEERDRSEARFAQTGFHQDYRTAPQEGQYKPKFHNEWASHFFHALNEAITERSARIITLRYLERTEFSMNGARVYERTLKENPEGLRDYNEVLTLIARIVQKLARGQNDEEVWNKFEKGLLQGERFEDGELKDMLENIFGEDFIKDLAWKMPDREDEFFAFIRKYEL